MPIAAGAATCATPSVTDVTPRTMSEDGGTNVTITGCGFTGATAVDFRGSGYPTPKFTVVSDTTITATAPPFPKAPGNRGGNGFPADVVVTTPAGSSPVTNADVVYFFAPGTPCSTAGLTASPASSSTGSTITLTGSTFSCPIPQFRFWIRPPGGNWMIVQDYSFTDYVNKYAWTAPFTAHVGTYGLEVDVREGGHDAVPYERVANITYTLSGCTGATISEAPGAPSNAGTTVTLSATATCPGTPTYRFWVSPLGGPSWIVRDYDTGNTFSWNTADLRVGTYRLEVDVRDHGSKDSSEKLASTTYALGLPCATPSLSASPASPGATGGTVVFTAGSSGFLNPMFRFWVWSQPTGWQVMQDFGPLATFTWTANAAPGNDRIEVDARDIGSSSGYDSYTSMYYSLAGATAVTLTADHPGGYGPGIPVALYASSTNPAGATPTYRFWLQTPDGAWRVVQNYSLANSFSWDTTAYAAGTYTFEVDVRDQGSTASYEAFATKRYIIG